MPTVGAGWVDACEKQCRVVGHIRLFDSVTFEQEHEWPCP